MKTFAEQKALVSQLNLMDDLFFHKVAEDNAACEEILRYSKKAGHYIMYAALWKKQMIL